jgi:hypothetical protein
MKPVAAATARASLIIFGTAVRTWPLGSTADRETKYDLGHDAAHQLVSATLKETSKSAVLKDQC